MSSIQHDVGFLAAFARLDARPVELNIGRIQRDGISGLQQMDLDLFMPHEARCWDVRRQRQGIGNRRHVFGQPLCVTNRTTPEKRKYNQYLRAHLPSDSLRERINSSGLSTRQFVIHF